MRYRIAPGEGYPTWEAVRNMLIRDGEIVVTIPEGVRVVAARCDDPNGQVSIDGQVVTTKIGYTRCTVSVDVEFDGESRTFEFDSAKVNSWNRMRFEPVDPSDPLSEFTLYENGIEVPVGGAARAKSSEQAEALPIYGLSCLVLAHDPRQPIEWVLI